MHRLLMPLLIQLIIALPFFLFLTSEKNLVDLIGQSGGVFLVPALHDVFLRYSAGLVIGVFTLVLLSWKFRSFDSVLNKWDVGSVLFSGLLYFIILSRLLQFPYGCDDVYIDYRYVRNFLDGFGMTYNPGQNVMGMTSQLHFVLLVSSAYLAHSRDIVVVSQFVNALLQVGIYISLFKIGLDLFKKRNLALISCALFALSPYQIGESFFGKETPLFLLVFLWTVWFVSVGRLKPAAMLSTLLVLIRPEGVLWLFCIFFVSVKKMRFSAWRIWVGPVLFMLIWYGLLYLFCGSILPQGGLAKSIIYHGIPPWGALVECLTFIGRSVLDTPWQAHDPLRYIFLLPDLTNHLLWIFLGTAALLLLWIYAKSESWLAIYNICVLLILVFFAVKNQPMFSWYFGWFSLIPLFLVPLLVRDMLRMAGKTQFLSLRMLLYVFSVFFLAVPILQQPKFDGYIPLPVLVWPDYQNRLVVYKEAADYLNRTAAPEAIVATPELGMFGYSFEGKVLDLGGLVSPQLLKYYPVPLNERYLVSNYTVPVKAIADMKPDYIVLMELFARNGLFKDTFFLQNYSLEREWPLVLWGGRTMRLYKRKECF